MSLSTSTINCGTISTTGITIDTCTSSSPSPTYVTTSTPIVNTSNLYVAPKDFKLFYQQNQKFTIKSSFEQKQEEKFNIQDVIEYVPQKVYEIKFSDDTSVKTICGELDEFDPEYMFYLAIAKKLYSNTLTFDGVLSKTYQLMYEKKYIKMVKKGLRLYKEVKKWKEEEEEQKEIKKRKKEKHIRKKLAAKERKKQEQIDIIKQAIILSKEES